MKLHLKMLVGFLSGYLVLLQHSVFARDNPCFLKTVIKVSAPERCWALTHPFVAGRALKLANEAREETARLLRDSLLDADPNGGQLDAFRHAYWMARMAQSMCWKKAIRLGIAHEKGNYRSFKKGKLEDGERSDSLASVMDLFNNQIGAKLGCQYKLESRDSLRTRIISAIEEGKMQILWKTASGSSLDCKGDPLDTANFKQEWYIPKCLVPSNFPRMPDGVIR